MILGFVSDAHGNALGLRRCVDALRRRGAHDIYFLGDAVGYLPGERAVLDLLAAEGIACQQGNHEAMLLGDLPLDPVRDEAYRLNAARDRLSADDLAAIRSWPRTRDVEADGRRLLLVHGSPADPLRDYVYPDSDLTPFAGLPYQAVMLGNTHRPFVAPSGEVLVVNVGSCGLPRDRGDLAACATYDTRTGTAEILRVPVPAADVLAQFAGGGSAVHPSVNGCLHRMPAEFVGTVVE